MEIKQEESYMVHLESEIGEIHTMAWWDKEKCQQVERRHWI